MKEKRKKHSTKELFELIDKMLEEKGVKPDNLDYGLGGDALCIILSEEFAIVPRVVYGSSEGIYLDIRLEGTEGFVSTGNENIVTLGTYKTLGESKEDYIKMAIIGAEFFFTLREYINSHSDEFNWTGTDALFFRKGRPVGKVWFSKMERAKASAETFLTEEKEGYVMLRDNETGEKYLQLAGWDTPSASIILSLEDRFDASDSDGKRNVFRVLINKHTSVDVMCNHDTGLVYIMEPAPEMPDILAKKICNFVRMIREA